MGILDAREDWMVRAKSYTDENGTRIVRPTSIAELLNV